VLAHIPPARCGLLPGSLTIFCDPPWSGSVSGGGVRRQPPWPRAPLPSWGVTPPGVVSSRPRSALPDRPRSYGLMRQTTPLPQPVVVPRSVGLCRLVRVPAGTWSFPTLSLRVCPSMRGPLPRRRGGCMYPLLPHHHRPSPSPHGSASRVNPFSDFRTGGDVGAAVIRSCSGLEVCCHPGRSYRRAITHGAAVAFTSEQHTSRYLPVHRIC
jgi:hypothetical protein